MVYNRLIDLLSSCRCEKGQVYTHTSMGKPLGSFNISDNLRDRFFELYERECFNGYNKFHITEKHDSISPILIDFDFKYDWNSEDDKEEITHFFDVDFLKEVIQIYTDWLKTYMVIDDPKQLQAFVLQRRRFYVLEKENKKFFKDGFHIQYPYLITEPGIQYLLRNHVLDVCKENFGIETLNSWDDIIDESVIERNNWLLYGSTKPGKNRYELCYIFDENIEEVKIDTNNEHAPKSLVRLLSIRGHINDNKVKEEYQQELEEKLELLQSRKQRKKKKEVKETKEELIVREVNASLTEEDRTLIEELVEMLSDARLESHFSRMEVGWTLHSISSDLFYIWDKFNQRRGDAYKKDKYIKRWNDMRYRRDGYTIGSLKFWAKMDSPNAYKMISERSQQLKLDKLIPKPEDYHIAEALHVKYGGSFVCADGAGDKWFYFNDHRWRESSKGLALKSKLSSELFKEYYRVAGLYANKVSMEDDDTQRIALEAIHSSILKTAKSLKSNARKNTVIKESIEFFHDNEFPDNLDKNPYLLCFENGVYDLENMEFRDGKPEDNCSMSTKYNYEEIDIEDETDEKTQDMLEFLEKVLPDPDIRHYTLKQIASGLSGLSNDELFHILTGVGGNGKTKLSNLIRVTLGDYFACIQSTMLTKERPSSNQATADIISLCKKRYVIASEPEQHSKINAGFMKLLSGGDVVKGRGLFERRELEYQPGFKIAMLCNDLPEINSNDGGVWRRLRCIHFGTKFVDNPIRSNEAKIDRRLNEKIPQWKERFMRLLLKYWVIYQKEGLQPPNEINKYTLEYQRRNDMFSSFIDDKLDNQNKNLSIKDKLSLADIFNEFREWFNHAFPNRKCPTRNEVKEGIDKLMEYKITKIGSDYFWTNLSWKEQIKEPTNTNNNTILE